MPGIVPEWITVPPELKGIEVYRSDPIRSTESVSHSETKQMATRGFID